MKIFKSIIPVTIGIAILAIALTNCSKDEPEDLGPIPVADFSASEVLIIKGDTITFTDLSTNTPTLWTWNFEGATPTYSNEASPSVVYEGQGIFSVTLTVRNTAGADEITKEGYIEVTAPPVIDIDVVPQVRLNFEDNLDNAGAVATAAVSSGAADYTTRPGGGKAFSFSGTNALTIPGYTGINGAESRSVSAWIKTAEAANMGVVHWGASGTLSRSSFKVHKSGVIRYEYQGGGHLGTSQIIDNEWHHVAYTYDRSTIKIYVDGIEEFTISDIVVNTGVAGETDVDIGSQLGGSAFIGAMDDVRIFKEVLTANEVLILSNIK